MLPFSRTLTIALLFCVAGLSAPTHAHAKAPAKAAAKRTVADGKRITMDRRNSSDRRSTAERRKQNEMVAVERRKAARRKVPRRRQIDPTTCERDYTVDEIEFRYPGPRPRTREAAILMLADAVESATRTMTEPNPGRIESLVRELSRKRLLDGQFDECDLTFRELGLIEDAVIARLCAIHHGRIAYPSAKPEEQPTDVVVPAEAS